MHTFRPADKNSNYSIAYNSDLSGDLIISRTDVARNGATSTAQWTIPAALVREFIMDRLAGEMISQLEQEPESTVRRLLGLKTP